MRRSVPFAAVLLAASALWGADQSEVTYAHDVAPILYKHCATCHRPGQVAPFALLTYEDAREHATSIAAAVGARLMPPWKPEHGYGDFRDERRLDDHEIEVIKRWVAKGAPRGDAREIPPPPQFTDGWQLGRPDVVLTMPRYTVKPEAHDVFRTFVIAIPVAAVTYVRGFEFRPGNRRVLHHSVAYLDRTGEARRKDEEDPGPGYSSFGGPGFTPEGALGGWSPGATGVMLPDGVAMVLRPGTDLVLQNHYRTAARDEEDQSQVALYFANKPPARIAITVPIMQQRLSIPPGEKRHVVHGEIQVPTDLDVIAVTPHMHFLGREMKLTAFGPDGNAIPMIWIKNWDYYWHNQYFYTTPLHIRAGTRVEMEAVFDNSADNTHNPHRPPERVTWGSESDDEMALCFTQIAIDRNVDLQPLLRAVMSQPGIIHQHNDFTQRVEH